VRDTNYWRITGWDTGKVIVDGKTVAGVKLSEKEVEYAAANSTDLEKVASENGGTRLWREAIHSSQTRDF